MKALMLYFRVMFGSMAFPAKRHHVKPVWFFVSVVMMVVSGLLATFLADKGFGRRQLSFLDSVSYRTTRTEWKHVSSFENTDGLLVGFTTSSRLSVSLSGGFSFFGAPISFTGFFEGRTCYVNCFCLCALFGQPVSFFSFCTQSAGAWRAAVYFLAFFALTGQSAGPGPALEESICRKKLLATRTCPTNLIFSHDSFLSRKEGCG